MKYLNWNSEKNEILKRERGISFEEIAYLIESGQIIGIEENPGRSNQKMYILEIENYAVIVPFIEKDLMESIERDEWQPVKNIDQEKEKAIAAARNTLKKEKRINLRLTQKDYHQIQIKAIEEGIPYQTLISSLVHKYLNGSLAPRS
jgi:predicted DNA binding CopG/RHH family protein